MEGIRAVFFDLSGVLYDGDSLITGAVNAVHFARERGLVLRFVTNTATKNHDQLLAKLKVLGVPLDDDELFTAPMAALSRVKKLGLRPYCLIHQNLQVDFAEVEQNHPNAVVLGDARDDLNYANLNRAFQIVQAGGPLIAIGCNRMFRENGELMLDAGAFVKAVTWAANTQAVITGKPSADFYQEVVASTPFEPGECLMIGDDAEADVAGAMQAGLQGCLVRTGKYQPGNEDGLPEGAGVIDSVSGLSGIIDQ